jgi:hypothetical protein
MNIEIILAAYCVPVLARDLAVCYSILLNEPSRSFIAALGLKPLCTHMLYIELIFTSYELHSDLHIYSVE